MTRRAGALALLLLVAPSAGPPALAAPPALKRGVNLEGWLASGVFAPLGPEKLAALKDVRAAGFDFVRVPLDPTLFLDARPGAAEPQGSLDRLLREAKARGLGVVVSLAPPPDLKSEVLRGGVKRDAYLVLVERLANRVAAANLARAVLEPLDEPVDPSRRDCGPSSFDWNAAVNDFVGAVRRGARTLPVLVTGACYSDWGSLTALKPLADKNVVYGFQYLDPLDFTQQGNPTNDEWRSLKNVRYAAAAADTMRRAFDAVGDWSRRHGVPVLVTSFGVHRSAPPTERSRWLRDVRAGAERQNFAWSAWTWESPYGFGISAGGKLSAEVKKALGM